MLAPPEGMTPPSKVDILHSAAGLCFDLTFPDDCETMWVSWPNLRQEAILRDPSAADLLGATGEAPSLKPAQPTTAPANFAEGQERGRSRWTSVMRNIEDREIKMSAKMQHKRTWRQKDGDDIGKERQRKGKKPMEQPKPAEDPGEAEDASGSEDLFITPHEIARRERGDEYDFEDGFVDDSEWQEMAPPPAELIVSEDSGFGTFLHGHQPPTRKAQRALTPPPPIPVPDSSVAPSPGDGVVRERKRRRKRSAGEDGGPRRRDRLGPIADPNDTTPEPESLFAEPPERSVDSPARSFIDLSAFPGLEPRLCQVFEVRPGEDPNNVDPIGHTLPFESTQILHQYFFAVGGNAGGDVRANVMTDLKARLHGIPRERRTRLLDECHGILAKWMTKQAKRRPAPQPSQPPSESVTIID